MSLTLDRCWCNACGWVSTDCSKLTSTRGGSGCSSCGGGAKFKCPQCGSTRASKVTSTPEAQARAERIPITVIKHQDWKRP